MNKKIIAAAIAASFIAPAAMAESAVTVYGKIHTSVDFIDADSGREDVTDVTSRASRLGFKGSEDLGDGLKAIFQVEFQIDSSDGGANPGVKYRNTFVGVAGDFGTALIGRHDTPLKMSTGKLDVFSDEMGDYNKLAGLEDVRADDAIAYVSPNFSGFSVAAAIIPGGDTGSVGEMDNIASGYSIAGMYDNGGLYLAAAYEDKEDHGAGTDELTRLGAGYTMDALSFGVVYEMAEDAAGDTDKLYISGKFKMGNNAIKAAWGNVDPDGGDETDAWAIGLDHSMSKRTKAYVQYADSEHGLQDVNGGAGSDISGFSLGLVHSF